MRRTTVHAGGILASVGLAASLLLGSCSDDAGNNTTDERSVAEECGATSVHYQPYPGVGPGLARLPWIRASPPSIGLTGHLFYYDRRNAWERERLSPLRMYSGGKSPDDRVSMKILWELRRGSVPPFLNVFATRIDGPGSSHQRLPSTSSDPSQFPSIIDIPTPGCWRLTLNAGATTGHIVIDVVPGR
jgi:hypothetical protein